MCFRRDLSQRILRGLGPDVDDHQRRDQLLGRNLVDGALVTAVIGRVDVGWGTPTA